VIDRASVLLTPRLALRPFSLDHLEAHANLYADPEVTRWIADGPFLGPAARERSERTVRRFVEHWRAYGFGVWAVEARESGRFLGQCGLNTIMGGLSRPPTPPALGAPRGVRGRTRGAPRRPDSLTGSEEGPAAGPEGSAAGPEGSAAGPEVEILWALERAAWGKGLATEAARAALDYAFDVIGLDRVVALARPANGRSRQIMEKLGMAWEQTVEAFGSPAVYYAIDRRPRP
jgi:RimJ/RimL family protein N-acetyltransferase